MAGFARSYLHRLTLDRPTSPEALFHEVAGLYGLVERRVEPITVRAFNPTMAGHGYESDGTVVEVHVDDSPFLVDSILNELEAHDLQVARVLHPVIGTRRDESGQLIGLDSARSSEVAESVQHYVLERRLFDADLPPLEQALKRVLADVQLVVRDFGAMVGVIPRMIEIARVGGDHYSGPETEEAIAFLQWLAEDNFVFLGYREYRLYDTPDGKAIRCDEGSGLGILSDPAGSKLSQPVLLSSLPPELAARYEKGDLLVISKTNRPATVHRRARMDYIGVRILGSDGETVGEARLVGLFTSKAYMERASRTPVLRRKLDHIASAEDLIEGSHDHKAVVSLFESFPKDELFGVPAEDLRRLLIGLLALQDRARVQLFVRRDFLDRSARVLVAMPRDRYSTNLAKSLERLFLERFQGRSVDYHLTLDASDLARLHFRVWVEEGSLPEVAYEELDAEVLALTRSWADRVADVLAARHGELAAHEMVAAWASRLPSYYTSSTELGVAAGDIERLAEMAKGDQPFVVGVQNETEGSELLTRVALYGHGKRHLSDLTPALEDFGLRVVEEVPTRLAGEEDLFVHDFGVVGPDGEQLDLEACGRRVTDALVAVWGGESEVDSLNRLVVVGGLGHGQVEILRAYGTYWRRVRSAFTVKYVNDTLVEHFEVTIRLMRLFEMRFDPDGDDSDYEALRYEVLGLLDAVPSLDQDRILRGFLRLIDATVRTNAYCSDRGPLAFKLRSSEVPDMPAPQPFMEVFVLGHQVEGIHLRAGPVARGGIRWSDRLEDYRTEVLGLLKAQITKNSVIVPTGAKGGFVLRRAPQDPREVPGKVLAAYQSFMRGILDITDNLVDGEIVHPPGVRVHDDDDPYLVVAADKGTASFSDAANQIAREYGFWLDDAFASGGSTGYDHKALGITARGAWKSLERHLLELGIDPHEEAFTVVGIGDMSGDVFGNGMLGSATMKLLAAFDHRHIFVDPDPDPSVSFGERTRLFGLAGSSWADYDPALISEGGGVYPRSAKKITLSEQARDALGTEMETVTPAELIRVILRAPVDLLWNGGIGTYVKASAEADEDVGDRANDGLRVNGSDLRCRVVVEGGNLGFTQLGRIEYAGLGGKINTDFIDNSGGVNCSDREVNLKILLRLARHNGSISREECDALLMEAADDVVGRILHDNFEQAQRLALEEKTSVNRMDSYEQLMVSLEEDGLLDRELEGLPSSEAMADRSRAKSGVSRPELGVLLAYAKRKMVDELLVSDVPDSPDLLTELAGYFPRIVSERFGHLIPDHPLRRELISTMVANDIADSQGSTFVSQVMGRTGGGITDVVRSYRTAREVAGGVARRRAIEELFGTVDPEVWTRVIHANDRLLATLTRWFLRHRGVPVREEVDRWADNFRILEESASTLGPPLWAADREPRVRQLEAAQVSPGLASRLALLPDLVHAPGILQLAQQSGRSVLEVGRVFFRIGQAVQLDVLERVLASMTATNLWHRWARQTIEDDLLDVRQLLAQQVLAEGENSPVDDAVDSFLASRAQALKRVLRLTPTLEAGSDQDMAFFMVVVRQIEALAADGRESR
jgi:glutamate dehydrogenase